jgi:hypothetical protein
MSNTVAVEMVRLYTYKNVNHNGYFDVPRDWLQKVINEMGYIGSVDSFLGGYTWDDSQFICENHMVSEWCPLCQAEVELPRIFKPHTCTNCQEKIIPCAQCEDQNCSECPLEI